MPKERLCYFSVEHPWTSLLDGVQDSCCCQSLLCSHCLNIHVLLYIVLNRSSKECYDYSYCSLHKTRYYYKIQQYVQQQQVLLVVRVNVIIIQQLSLLMFKPWSTTVTGICNTRWLTESQF